MVHAHSALKLEENVQYSLGHSLGEKITLHQMKNEKNNEVHICGFWYSKNMANFEVFLMNDLVEFVIKEF